MAALGLVMERFSYCRYEGEHNQRRLEESRLKMASRIDWTTRERGLAGRSQKSRAELRGHQK